MENTTRAQMFIEAAAALAERDPATLDEYEAMYILMEFKSDAKGDLYRQLVKTAADRYFSDPEIVEMWADAAANWDHELPDLVAFTLRGALMPTIRDVAEKMQEATEAGRYELERIRETAAAATMTGTQRDALLKKTLESLATIRREIGDDSLLDDPNPATAVFEAVQEIVKNQQAVAEALKKRARANHDLMQNLEVWDRLRELVNTFTETNPLYDLYLWVTGPELAPYLAEELKKPQYQGKTIKQLWTETEKDDDGLFPDDSLVMQAIIAADTAFEEAGAGGAHKDIDAAAAREAEAIPAAELDAITGAGEPETAAGDKTQQKQLLEKVKYKRHSLAITLSVGKGALRLFDPREWDRGRALAARKQIPGQMSLIPISYESAGKKDTITLYCGMTSDSFLSSMTPEDFFILSFLDDAFVNDNKKCSVHWLFKEYLGERPSERQLDDFYKKLEALASTTLRINDKEIQKAWAAKDDNRGKKAKYREIIQAAAPIKLGAEKYVAGGQVADAAVLIYDRPAVLQADLLAKQITTVPKSLLQVKKPNGRYASRTPRFYRVLFYLIRHIALIKKGLQHNIIVYNTFYTETGETTHNGKQQAYKTMMDIIHHFESEGWITGHKTTKSKTTGDEGLSFTWTDEAGRITSTAHRKRRRITQKPAAK